MSNLLFSELLVVFIRHTLCICGKICGIEENVPNIYNLSGNVDLVS